MTAGAVGADAVALNQAACPGSYLDTNDLVGGDEVAGTGDGAAHRVTRATQKHPVTAVAKSMAAGAVGADTVALDQVPRAAPAREEAVFRVAGDEVAGSGGSAAHRDARAGQF